MTMPAAVSNSSRPAGGVAGRPEIVLKSSEFRKGREEGWRELEDLIKRVERGGVRKLSLDELQRLPILYVDAIPVRVDGQGVVTSVGLLLRVTGEGRITRALVSGRVLYHERVRSALRALGLALPPQRIAVNLSPADLVKEGSHYDLPIALGLMAAIGAIPPDALSGFTVLGDPLAVRISVADGGSIAELPAALASSLAVTTGREGKAALDYLSAGDQLVAVQITAEPIGSQDLVLVELRSRERQAATIAINLRPTSRLTGRVRNRAGQPRSWRPS